MTVFEWEDGFTPYSATVDGVTLTEYQGETVERVSRLARRPQWDTHPNREEYSMADGFSSGEVDGVAVAWINGDAFELMSSGDFDCCTSGECADAEPVSVALPDADDDGTSLTLTLDGSHVMVRVMGADGDYMAARVAVDAFADASAYVIESEQVTA